MPTVEMHEPGQGAPAAPAAPETPSQQVVRRASVERTVTAADGKVISYRPLRTLERMDLNAIAGAQNALNLAWMADASLAFSVTKIDGQPEPKPATMPQLRALILRLGDDGMDAIADDVRASMPAEGEADAAAVKDKAGN